jgi:hypothetical protein
MIRAIQMFKTTTKQKAKAWNTPQIKGIKTAVNSN